EGGFRVLSSFVKKGGVMLIWVYGRLHTGAAVYMYEPIRLVTRHLPKRLLVPLCHPFAAIVHGLNKISDFFASHPFTAHAATLIPFQYYRQFPYEVKLNDAFDVLATPKSRYYHMQTIKEWFERIRLKPTLQYLRKKSIIGFAYNNNSEQSA